MEILVLGGGISGCSVAYLLKKSGHNVRLIEREDTVGGLCRTYRMGDVNFEFGPHICYAADNTPANDFFHELLPEFRAIKYFPKQSMDGEIQDLATFPITVANVLKLPYEDQVRAIEELYHINLESPNYDNFEQYIISRVGKTMYEYCFKNYNRKQWGMEPKDMDSEWARFRNFYLRSGDYGMFGDKWQGHPGTYTPFFSRLVDGIDIVQDNIEKIVIENESVKEIVATKGNYKAELIISTLPIDFLLNREDELEYRGITKIFYQLQGISGLPTYLCTFPNHYSWTRITDYVLQAEQNSESSVISFAIPHSSKDKQLDMGKWLEETEWFIKEKLKKQVIDKKVINYDHVYPISSSSMLEKYNDMIREVAKVKNLLSFGRMGLYSYISMCTAVDQASNVVKVLPEFTQMNLEDRLKFYKKMREELA